VEIHISGDPLTMYSDVGAAPSFNIFMTGNQATFNMVVPIGDYHITVENAKAVLIPEPSQTFLALLAVPWLMRRKRNSPV
jgi:hypothetical protein